MRHSALISWRAEGDFAAGTYSRGHEWRFDGGAVVAASSSPGVVPVPLSRPEAVDPEEAFVAAISSCHMLWFLDLARRAGFVAESYEDFAEGRMQSRDGRMQITRVTLSPRVIWAKPPTRYREAELHHQAHDACFIANSVRSEIVIALQEESQDVCASD